MKWTASQLPEPVEIDRRRKRIGDFIRIFHVSDLHFNQIDRNKKKAFENHFEAHRPHIVVISGDIVQHPFYKKNFQDALAFTKYLENEALVILASGNHDRFFAQTNKIYEKQFDIPAFYCYYVRFSGDRNFTFFVFDSSSARTFKGRITNQQLNYVDRCREYLHSKYVQNYERSYKIAVLHHHPLPTRTHHLEGRLYMKEAGQFIEKLHRLNVNMVLHGHQHDPVDYSFQWNLRDIIPQPHMMILSAGTLLKDLKIEPEKLKKETDEKTNYYSVDVYKNKVEGRQMFYHYPKKNFVRKKSFSELIHIPKYHKFKVDLTWEIQAPDFDNKVTRVLTFQAWAGDRITNFRERIGSTAPAKFKQLNFHVKRAGKGNIRVASKREETTPEGIILIDINFKLDPPMYTTDDKITIEYSWPRDFEDDLSKGYVNDSYEEVDFVDEFTLRIKDVGINIKECTIGTTDESISGPINKNVWEFNVEGLQERTPIYYDITC